MAVVKDSETKKSSSGDLALLLRLPHRNDAKIAGIYNFWTFWPVIQQIRDLFEI